MLAVISAEQTEKLRAAIERGEHQRPPELHDTEQNGEVYLGMYFYREEDGTPLSLPTAYQELAVAETRHQLGLSPRRRSSCERFRKNTKRKRSLSPTSCFQLKPEERSGKMPDLSRRESEAIEGTQRQIASLLTPKQAATLKEIDFRNAVLNALLHPGVQKTVGITAEQSAAEANYRRAKHKPHINLAQSGAGKIDGRAHAREKQKLREEFDRHGWSVDYSAEPTPNDIGTTTGEAVPAPGMGPVTVGTATITGTGTLTITGGGVVSAEVGPTPDDSFAPLYPRYDFSLPVYSRLGDREVRKQLGLSPEQVAKLREASAKLEAEFQKVAQNEWEKVQKLPRNQRHAKDAETSRKLEQWREQHKGPVAKAVEKIITAQQLDAYKKLAFPSAANYLLTDAAVLKPIAATPKQRERLKQLDTEFTREYQRWEQQSVDRLLAVLSPEQKAKLRAAIERREHQMTELPAGALPAGAVVQEPAESQGGVLHVFISTYAYSSSSSPDGGETFGPYLRLPTPYEGLADGAVRKQLGWSTVQEKRLRGISGKYTKLIEDFSDEMAEASKRKLTPEERQRHLPEFLRKNQEEQDKEGNICRQIADLLTPKQAAALKEIDFRAAVPIALWHRGVQRTVGMTEDQKARLNRIANQLREDQALAGRATDEKSLALLTPAQSGSSARSWTDRDGSGTSGQWPMGSERSLWRSPGPGGEAF